MLRHATGLVRRSRGEAGQEDAFSLTWDLQPASQPGPPMIPPPLPKQEDTSSFVTTFFGPPRPNQRVSCLHGFVEPHRGYTRLGGIMTAIVRLGQVPRYLSLSINNGQLLLDEGLCDLKPAKSVLRRGPPFLGST